MDNRKIEIFRQTELFHDLNEEVLRVFLRLQNQGLIVADEKQVIVPDLQALAGYADSER